MKKKPALREIIIFIAFIFCAYFAFVKKWDNVKLREDKIRSEERIKSLEQNDKAKEVLIDSFKTNTKILEGVIEYQNKNPKLIIEKHDKIRNTVNVLNADRTIGYLSDRLSKEGGHR